jgi:hypothetical protein
MQCAQHSASRATLALSTQPAGLTGFGARTQRESVSIPQVCSACLRQGWWSVKATPVHSMVVRRQKLGGPSRRGFPGFWKEGLQKSRRKPPLFPQCVSGRGGLRKPTGSLLPEDGLFRKYVAVRCAEAAAFCKSPSGRCAAEGGKPVCRKGMFAGRRESLREVGCCKHCAVFSAVCAQHAECRSCGCVPACVADLARYC